MSHRASSWSKLALGDRNLSHAKWANIREKTRSTLSKVPLWNFSQNVVQGVQFPAALAHFCGKNVTDGAVLRMKSMASIGVLRKGVEISCKERSHRRSPEVVSPDSANSRDTKNHENNFIYLFRRFCPFCGASRLPVVPAESFSMPEFAFPSLVMLMESSKSLPANIIPVISVRNECTE